MKNALWAIAAGFALLVTGSVLVVGYYAIQPPAAPAPTAASQAIVDPFKPKPAIVDPFKPAPAAAPAGCPAGFVDQGGLCVSQASIDYQADTKRRQENRELARDIADELRAD